MCTCQKVTHSTYISEPISEIDDKICTNNLSNFLGLILMFGCNYIPSKMQSLNTDSHVFKACNHNTLVFDKSF